MAFTLAEVTEFYTASKSAYLKAIQANNYSINTGGSSRSITRQELAELKSTMLYWQDQITKIEAGTGGLSVKFGTSNR